MFLHSWTMSICRLKQELFRQAGWIISVTAAAAAACSGCCLLECTNWEDVAQSCMHKQFCRLRFAHSISHRYIHNEITAPAEYWSFSFSSVAPTNSHSHVKKKEKRGKYVRLKNINTNLQYDPESNSFSCASAEPRIILPVSARGELLALLAVTLSSASYSARLQNKTCSTGPPGTGEADSESSECPSFDWV